MTIFRLLTTMTTAGGKKTTHAVYGEALGILSGDALLNYAYETALSSLADGKQTDRKIRALRILANKSGVYGMLGGQSVDVQNEKMGSLSLSSQELDYIYLHKTSALLEASLEMGAVLAGAGEREAAAMEQIGRKTGLAFQIRDDILDVTGTRETLGKPVLSDAKNQKTTYVTLYGTEKSGGDRAGAHRRGGKTSGEASGRKRISLRTAGMDGLPGEIKENNSTDKDGWEC